MKDPDYVTAAKEERDKARDDANEAQLWLWGALIISAGLGFVNALAGGSLWMYPIIWLPYVGALAHSLVRFRLQTLAHRRLMKAYDRRLQEWAELGREEPPL